MEYRQIGNTSLRASRIGFGCMSLHEINTSNISLLQKAIDTGINYFDTADLYDKGENERLLGKAVAGRRSEVIIATKAGNQWRSDGSGWDWNPRKTYLLQAAEASLKRLGTEYIDLFQLHGGTIEDNFDEVLEAFTLLQQQGKIRYYGISSLRPNVIRWWMESGKTASVMIPYSLLDRRPEETILDDLQHRQIGVLARGTLAQGLLTGKPSKDYLGYSAADVKKMSDAVAALAGEKRSAAAIALRFVLQHPAVSVAVTGIRTAAQLREAIEADSISFTVDEYEMLKGILEAQVYEAHR